MPETYPPARSANEDQQAQQDKAGNAREQGVGLSGRDADERNNQRAADAEEQRRRNAEQQRDASRDRDAANADRAAELGQREAD